MASWRSWREILRISPSPGTPGEGRGERLTADFGLRVKCKEPSPPPSPGVPGEEGRCQTSSPATCIRGVKTACPAFYSRGRHFIGEGKPCVDSSSPAFSLRRWQLFLHA